MKPYGVDRHYEKDVNLDGIACGLPDTNTYRKTRAKWKRALRGHARMAGKKALQKAARDLGN